MHWCFYKTNIQKNVFLIFHTLLYLVRYLQEIDLIKNVKKFLTPVIKKFFTLPEEICSAFFFFFFLNIEKEEHYSVTYRQMAQR